MTFGCDATLMMSGAWPPPAPSVWKAWMVRPLMARIVSSTKPLSFSVSVWIITCTSYCVGDVEAVVDRGGRRAPVLVQLERGGAGEDHLLERRRQRGVALAGEREVHREGVEALDHALDVPGAGAGGGERAVRRAGAAAEHGGDARHQRFLDLLRADEVDMRVHAAGGEDLALAGDGLGGGADDDGDARLRVGIAGLADRRDAAVLQADVGLVDAGVVDDQRVGDDRVDRALRPRHLALAHAVADDLAAAELHLLAIGAKVLLDLDEEFGVGEPHLVADGRAEHLGIGGAGDSCGHGVDQPDLERR